MPTEQPTVAPATVAINLEMPAEPRFLRTARLVAASAAADAGFDIDDVEDARIAVDELCALILELRPRSTIALRFVIEPGTLQLHARAAIDTSDGTAPSDPVRIAVLGAVVDSHTILIEDGQAVVGFSKSVTDPT